MKSFLVRLQSFDGGCGWHTLSEFVVASCGNTSTYKTEIYQHETPASCSTYRNWETKTRHFVIYSKELQLYYKGKCKTQTNIVRGINNKPCIVTVIGLIILKPTELRRKNF